MIEEHINWKAPWYCTVSKFKNKSTMRQQYRKAAWSTFDQKLNQHQLFLPKVFIKKVGKEMRQQGTNFFEKEYIICPWTKQCFKEKQRWLSLILINRLMYLDNQQLINIAWKRSREGNGEESDHFLALFWHARPKSTEEKRRVKDIEETSPENCISGC